MRLRLDIRKHLFTKRVVRHWDRVEVVDALSLSMFRSHLDNPLNDVLTWSALSCQVVGLHDAVGAFQVKQSMLF